MKCIHCETDCKAKDRPTGRCPKCGHKFVFDPQKQDPVTDMLFLNAVKAVSGDGKVRWGVEHLYYEVCRRKKGKKVPRIVIVFLLIVAAVLVSMSAAVGGKGTVPLVVFGGIATLFALISVATRLRGPFVKVDLSTFNRLYDRWKDVNGSPPGVIERVPEPELPKDLEADIGDYSFDRAVICDRARTVDLLVANNFHFENNCAILTLDGYPKGPFEVIKKMLKRNPKLQVFVLHDASEFGCRLAHKLVTDPDWFGGAGLRVIDLGLRPRHAKPFAGLLVHPQGRLVDPTDGITPEEAEWLTHHKLELAAARPEQVLKRLFAGLQAHANDDPRQKDTGPQGADGGLVTYCGAFDAGGYGGDGGGDGGADGGADAFG